ncbi:MAG: response regulator [Candidatus Magnetominusculus sp. LBB02]|nr:response regulator [Candidatus Magnetominusculus sp. LBB02]
MDVNLLTVDDDPDIRRLFELQLPKLGYRVTTASGADEALRLVEEANPHVVLLDQEMPGGDGLSAFLRIKALRPDLPVVMCTGHGSIELVRVFMLKGGNDFIQKPILDMETLDFRLRKVLRDIKSDRETHEALVAAYTKLETEAFKSGLLAQMSHELLTPLHHLMGYTQMLGEGGGQQAALLPKIMDSAERLSAIVDKILAAAGQQGQRI